MVDIGDRAVRMTSDLGVSWDSVFREKNRENGASQLRSRRCNRGRTLQQTTAEIEGAELTVTYETTSKGQVRDVFTPKILTIKE